MFLLSEVNSSGAGAAQVRRAGACVGEVHLMQTHRGAAHLAYQR